MTGENGFLSVRAIEPSHSRIGAVLSTVTRPMFAYARADMALRAKVLAPSTHRMNLSTRVGVGNVELCC